ncbi:MAG: DVUA0089 family protein [Deltaproteobacteria bacterium]|nr:DVUA0089 family protein [Deltaproteobacteria bacterium]
MHRVALIRTGLALLAGAGLLAACGGADETKARPKPLTSAASTTSSASGEGGAGGDSGGVGGAGASTGSTSGGGEGGAPPEDCFDGIDNDQNGKIDCLDNDPACLDLCIGTGDICIGTKVLADPTLDIVGDNTEFARYPGVSCGTQQPDLHGPANIYQVKAASDGVLDASVTPDSMPDDLVLTVRSVCADPKAELACGDGLGTECVRVPVKKGDDLFLVVAGYSLLNYGPYKLSVRTRPTKCGDTLLDPTETCDDGNAASGDGCSATCQIELSEVEDNGTVAKANPFKEPMLGRIDPTNDVDVISFQVTKPNSTVVATTLDIPGNGCAKRFIDSYLELIGSDGTTILAANDDMGGITAKVSKTGLAVGTYYLRLSAAPGAPPNHTFAYRWSVKLTP